MDNMKSDELALLVSKFLDGDLSADEEREALHRIAEDAHSRELLRFDSFLETSLQKRFDPESFAVPEGFTDSVMHQIEQMEVVNETYGTWFDDILALVSGWFRLQDYTFRPVFVYALPVLLLAGFVALMQLKGDSEMAMPGGETIAEYTSFDGEQEQVWIRFVYMDQDADELAVAGNFSDWNPIEMESQIVGDKIVWTSMIPVERGEHHYMFIRNGEEWITDPLAEVYRDDGFGNKNAVIYL